MSRKVIIIDDEPHCRNVVAKIIAEHCPDLNVVAECVAGSRMLRATPSPTGDEMYSYE